MAEHVERVDQGRVKEDKSLVDPRNHNTEDNGTRRQAAVKLKVFGASYTEIADTLGYSTPATARKAVERGIAEAAATTDDREKVRWLLDARLERLYASVSGKATREGPDHLDYAGAALRILDRKMALHGLSSSTVNINPAPERVQQMVAELSALAVHATDQEADIIEAEVDEDDEVAV
jgi:hypothetical protein